MTQQLRIQRDDDVVTWVIDVPGTGNAISGAQFIHELEAAVDTVNRDATVAAVVLTGAGKHFSAGGNVREMVEREGIFALSAIEQRHAYSDTIQRIPRAMSRCEVPVIAAVNGAAVGAGCDLALMCDLRVASTEAFFAESFVKIGLVPGDGGPWFLRRAIGEARAAEMTLTGDRIDATTALEWGLVSRVVPPDELLATAHWLAGRIGSNPGPAVRMAKRILVASRTDSLESVLGLAAALQPLAQGSPEHRDRVEDWRARQLERTAR